MFKYIDLYEVGFDSWDVYAFTDPEYYPEYIAITGPDSFLKEVYEASKTSLEKFDSLIKTDFYRGIDFHEASTLAAVLETIGAA